MEGRAAGQAPAGGRLGGIRYRNGHGSPPRRQRFLRSLLLGRRQHGGEGGGDRRCHRGAAGGAPTNIRQGVKATAVAGDNASGEGYSLWAYMTTLSDRSASVISIVCTQVARLITPGRKAGRQNEPRPRHSTATVRAMR